MMRRAAGLLVCIVATLPARAEQVGPPPLRERFPVGSITTRATAQQAIDAADRRNNEVEAAYTEQRERCNHTFLVNHCTEAARQRQQVAYRDLRAVQLEAREAIRQFDAAERAAHRAEQDREREAAADRDAQQKQARRSAYEQRQAESQAHQQAPAVDVRARAASEQAAQRQAAKARTERKRLLDAREDAERRAANVERLRQKQRDAAEYARQHAADKVENEKKRAERIRDRQQRNAQAGIAEVPPSNTAPPR